MDSKAAEQELCERMGIPVSELPPEETMRRVMGARNERKRYHRTCDATGSNIISAYPPDSPYTIYRNDTWWGDTWEALEYGRALSFEKPFFEQFAELQRVVPREGTTVFRSENCDYNSHIRDSKNCYLNALIANCEDAYYCYWVVRDKDVMDSLYLNDCTLCYECIDVTHGYDCIALQDSTNCHDCYFSYQLLGCKNCILCSNLVNKEYHVHNVPCSKEQFEEEKRNMLNGSWQHWQSAYAAFLDLKKQSIQRAVHVLNCEDVSGDHLMGCRRCFDCFDCYGGEDSSNLISMADSKDIRNSYAIGWPASEMVYCGNVVRGSTDIAYCSYVWFSSALRYCESCQSCKHCFGCTGLRQKAYCILNKQYTKEEYEALTPKLIEHMRRTKEWGEFFPAACLPHGYNETAAQEYFPLTKEEALKRGFAWNDYESPLPKAEKLIKADDVPDAIDDVPSDILNWAIECEVSKKPFKIIKQELDFYRRMKLPIPRKHPDQRHTRRMSLRNPRTLWNRSCAKCQKDIQTTYAPERPEIVYCEECYLKEVY